MALTQNYSNDNGTWTPVLTFATPGNLSVAYTRQLGFWYRFGGLVMVSFSIVTSSFTHTTASGNCTITGLPFVCATPDANMVFDGPLSWSGITKASYTDIQARVTAGGSTFVLDASGSGQALSTIAATDTPSGGSIILRSSVVYPVA